MGSSHVGVQMMKHGSMVNFYAIPRCLNWTDTDKGKSFFCLPSIIRYQGADTESLSTKRQRDCLAEIRRKELKKIITNTLGSALTISSVVSLAHCTIAQTQIGYRHLILATQMETLDQMN